jgi:hypothetical protein
MLFTKLTEAEIAEFMELIRDSFDPELYTEDDLPALRAGRQAGERAETLQERAPTPEHDPEIWEPCDWREEEWPPSFPPWPDKL